MDQIIEFISNHLILFFSFVIILFMIVSFEVGALTSKFRALTSFELTSLINRDKITLIDLRAEEDYKIGHIIDSINLNIDAVEKKEFDKKLPVVTYSNDENDAIKAAKKFVQLDYQTVYYLQGGIKSWIDNDMPLSGEKKHGK